MQRVVIIDPDFEQLGGHNITANEIITARIKAPVDIVCSSKLPGEFFLEGATVRRVLPFNSYEAHERHRSLSRKARMLLHRVLRRKPDPQVDATGFGFELLRVFRSMGISAQDALVVHTGSAVILNAIMDALDEVSETDWPDLHFRQLRPLENMSYERATHLRLKRMRELGKVFMYAETNSFAARLATLEYDRRSIELVEFSDISRPLSRRPDPEAEFEVAMLGTVRIEKGHGQLVSIARSYRTIVERLGGPPMKLLIHTGAVKNRKLFRTMLDGLEGAGINFELSGADTGLTGHWICLQRCHAVIMPYDHRRYIERGSGIGIDAVAHGRPLIVAGNSTLDEYIRNGNGMAANGDRQMAEALHGIATDYSEFADNALELAKVFRKQQMQSALFKRLNASAS
ncbi:MAG: hypothetical protein AAFW74_08930 [Pseudomonadota bacterium]